VNERESTKERERERERERESARERERDKERRRYQVFPLYRQDFPCDYLSSLSVISERDKRERDRGETERESERKREKLDAVTPGVPLNMESLSVYHYQTHTPTFQTNR
jgi:hypothetical protein